jgi:hypothetical protein
LRELSCFNHIPVRNTPLLPPYIQNAEHLADHFHPRFRIPSRRERESLQVGQAVKLYVYGPKSTAKHDTVEVRISGRSGDGAGVRYAAEVETPSHETHWIERVAQFGPEHVATVLIPVAKRKSAAKATKNSRSKKVSLVKKPKLPTKAKPTAKDLKAKRRR